MTEKTPEQQRRHAAYTVAGEFNAANPPGSPVLAWPGVRPTTEEIAAGSTSWTRLVTRTRGGAWVLQSGEPVVAVLGHSGGISLEHIEPDPTRQPAPPEIAFETPPCPMCSTALDTDGDSFVCYPCRCSWDMNGTGGRWHDDALRCAATAAWGDGDAMLEQCARAKNHDLDSSTAAAAHVNTDGDTWHDSSKHSRTDGSGESTQ